MADPKPRALLRTVPRLQRLAVFDAAARLGSFTAAAAELGITQPAVTRHIKELERDLGIRLFNRSANRSELTEDGWSLRHLVEDSFSILERGLADLIESDDELVLAMHPGVAQHWLVPRIDRLQAALGDTDLRLWIFDREAELATGDFDAAIRVGDGAWAGYTSQLLFDEIVAPVASPDFAARHGLTKESSAAEVFDAPLLHMDSGDRPWTSWGTWLARFDIELPRRPRRVVYDNYPMVVQEAMAGRGVALGWRYVVDDLLERELLAIVGPEVTSTERGYYLCWPTARPNTKVRVLADWLAAEFAGSSAHGA